MDFYVIITLGNLPMPRTARYPHMEKQGPVWHARLDVPRDLRHHFVDGQHPNGRRVLSRSTGQTEASQAYDIAKPIIDGWKTRFADLRRGGKTATQVKAQQLAKKYATAKTLDPTEAEYVRLVEIFDFAAQDLAGISSRDWHERLAAFGLDPARALRSVEQGENAIEQVEVITGNRTPFLAKIVDFKIALARELDAKTAYEYGQDTGHFASMFPDLTVED